MIKENREVAPLHPGRVLGMEFLEPLDMNGGELARGLHTNEQKVYAVLRGERGLSIGLAVRLGRYFDIEPEFFVNLQSRYDLEMEKMKVGRQVEEEIVPLQRTA